MLNDRLRAESPRQACRSDAALPKACTSPMEGCSVSRVGQKNFHVRAIEMAKLAGTYIRD